MAYTSWCGLSRPWEALAISWRCRFFRGHVHRDMAQLGALGALAGTDSHCRQKHDKTTTTATTTTTRRVGSQVNF